MNEFDPKKIEQLLKENKLEEAREYLHGFFKKDMTDVEKAAVHFDFAMLYLKVMNAIKEERNKNLREVLSDLKLLSKTEKKAKNVLKLTKVRVDLQS